MIIQKQDTFTLWKLFLHENGELPDWVDELWLEEELNKHMDYGWTFKSPESCGLNSWRLTNDRDWLIPNSRAYDMEEVREQIHQVCGSDTYEAILRLNAGELMV